MPNNKLIDIAVVGCGMLAQGMHLPNIVKNPRFNLKWCCDVNKSILEEVKKYNPKHVTSDARRVADDNDCEFVVICTHHEVRGELIELFAKAGKHIYAEKPLASNIDEVKYLYDLVNNSNIAFCLGHNRRCAPAIKDARGIYLKHKAKPANPSWRYDREGIGGPDNDWDKRTLILQRVNDDALSWKKWAFGDGTLYVEMTHFVDLAIYVTDLMPKSVCVIGDHNTNFSVHSINIEFEDDSLGVIVSTVNGTFGYPKELLEVYYGGAAIIVDHCVELRVAGIEGQPFFRTYPLSSTEYGSIHSDGGIKDYYLKTLAQQQDVINGVKEICPGLMPDKGHYAMLEEFVDAAINGRTSPCGIRDAAITTATMFQVLESARSGGVKKNIDLSYFAADTGNSA